MAIKIYDKFAPRANPADADYPYGSIKNESVPGAKDGTPLDAVWANDYAGFDAELFAQADVVPNGTPDKKGASQRVDALRALFDTESTVSELATGKFQVGKRIGVTDRALGVFLVQSGGTPNGYDILDAGNGNTAALTTTGYANALWFGIKPTIGASTVIDNKPSIDRAMEIVNVLHFPHIAGGTYWSSGGHVLSKSFAMFGDGMLASTLLRQIGNVNQDFIRNINENYKLQIMDMAVHGSGLNAAGGTLNPQFTMGIRCILGALHLERVDIQRFPSTCVYTGNTLDAYYDIDKYAGPIRIINCNIFNGDGLTDSEKFFDCLRIERSHDVRISGNTVTGGLSSIRTQYYCKDMIICNNISDTSWGDVGITIALSTDIKIHDNISRGHHRYGIEYDGSWRVGIHNNDCYENNLSGIYGSSIEPPVNSHGQTFVGKMTDNDGTVYTITNATNTLNKDVKISGGSVYGHNATGIASIGSKDLTISDVTLRDNCRSGGSNDAHIRISTNADSSFAQGVHVESCKGIGNSNTKYLISISAYQFQKAYGEKVTASNNTYQNCQLSNVPIEDENNKIVFDNVFNKFNIPLSLTATVSTDNVAKNGYYWTLVDSAGAATGQVSWRAPVSPVAKRVLVKVTHRGTSSAFSIALQTYKTDASQVQTFVATVLNDAVVTTGGWTDTYRLVTLPETDNYDAIALLLQSSGANAATVDIAFAGAWIGQ